MYKATAALMSAVTRISCRDAQSRREQADGERRRHHHEKRVQDVVPAMMRERCAGSLRDWIRAYSGTM